MHIIYEITLLITLLKSIVLVRKFGLSNQNFLLIYLLITFFIEIFSRIVLLLDKDSNWNFQYNLYCIFCIFFFGIYYSRQLDKNLKKKIKILATVLVISILIFKNTFAETLDSILVISLPLFYILYALVWFYQKINLPSEAKITDDPVFWISTALLFWSCFFIFRVIPRYLFDTVDKDFLILLRELAYIVNSVMYALFYYSLVKYEQITKTSTK